MSDDAPAIPFVLPPARDFTVAWRKPVFPAHLHALADPQRGDGARTRAAQAFITRALANGPRPAAQVEREAALLGISKRTLFRARNACNCRMRPRQRSWRTSQCRRVALGAAPAQHFATG